VIAPKLKEQQTGGMEVERVDRIPDDGVERGCLGRYVPLFMASLPQRRATFISILHVDASGYGKQVTTINSLV
jgi:hypothetical protein